MSTIDSANPPQEFPDIVGARPTNPLAANFKSFIPASANLPELTWPHLSLARFSELFSARRRFTLCSKSD
jgi:hypothetical protein